MNTLIFGYYLDSYLDLKVKPNNNGNLLKFLKFQTNNFKKILHLKIYVIMTEPKFFFW
jgi:hypothetical protein